MPPPTPPPAPLLLSPLLLLLPYMSRSLNSHTWYGVELPRRSTFDSPPSRIKVRPGAASSGILRDDWWVPVRECWTP